MDDDIKVLQRDVAVLIEQVKTLHEKIRALREEFKVGAETADERITDLEANAVAQSNQIAELSTRTSGLTRLG